MLKEAPYWMAFTHLPNWRTEAVNNLINEILAERKINFTDFFELKEENWKEKFLLNDSQISGLVQSKSELPNYSFLAESLYDQGFEIIPLNSPDYSQVLKENLKLKSPPILYVKGNKGLLNEECVAVVGSRNASEISLKFTENLAIQLAKEFKVVVSGFAKGVDLKSLEASIENNGNSIIVLPQGVLTFAGGIKKYYSQLVEGQILVVSTFHPNAPWNVKLAMARNAYIYGLAQEIYVAESGEEGGTWAGATDGLRKGRKVYVRIPEKGEVNANEVLIQKGATPVNFSGSIVSSEKTQVSEPRKEYKGKSKKKSGAIQTNLFDS